MMAGALTGCGKKEVDVMAGIEVEFSGVDGYGTAFTCTSQAELNAHYKSDVCDYHNCGVTEYTDNVWVVDSEGWTESINITKCAVCGAQG